MKQIIRLTESDLHRIIIESVNRILLEADASDSGDVSQPVFSIVRRPSPVGEPTDEVEDGLDNRDAISRDGGKNHSIIVNDI